MLNGCTLKKLPVAARYSGNGGGQLTHCILSDNAEDIVVIDGPGPRIRPVEAAEE